MSGERWTISNTHQLEMFIERTRELFKQNGRITYAKPEIGNGRSLTQNALFHLWMREYAGHLLGKTPHLVSKGELDGMKRHAKLMFYKDAGEEWMLHTITNPKTGETKRDARSTSDLNAGQMFTFMEWVQRMAAVDGLVLESKGDFLENKKKQTEV